VRELFAVDAVVLVLAAVDRFQVQRVGEHEGQPLALAGVGEPVPVEGAFAADSQIVSVGFDAFEEVGEVIALDVGVEEFVPGPIHDADVHLAAVQIDSAVELGGGCVILHVAPRFLGA